MTEHPQTSVPPASVVDAAPRDRRVVKSAARVLRIFELFDDIEREARLGEISKRLDLPVSSTSMLLRSLVELGYLTNDPVRHTFAPTARIGLLGSWTARELAQDGGLTELLHGLSADTGETISLAARNGIYAQYIRVVQATNALRIHVPTGTCRPLVWSAAGFALISEMEEDAIAALVRRTNAEDRAGKPLIELDQVLRHVSRFREDGYFLSRGLVTPGGGHISMRFDIVGPCGHRSMYALGVAGWVDRIERDQAHIVDCMRAALRRNRDGNACRHPVDSE